MDQRLSKLKMWNNYGKIFFRDMTKRRKRKNRMYQGRDLIIFAENMEESIRRDSLENMEESSNVCVDGKRVDEGHRQEISFE